MGFPTLDGVPAYLRFPQQAPTPPPPPPPEPQEQLHLVKDGESLSSIAKQYSTPEAPVTAEQIAQRNGIEVGALKPDQQLIVPTIKQHAEPKAAPNATPEQGATNAAMDKHLTAADNLSAFTSHYQGPRKDEGYQSTRDGYQTLVTNSGGELNKAIAAEVRAAYDAQPHAPGQSFDAAAAKQYGAEVVKRFDNDPAAKAAAQSAVDKFAVDTEVDGALTAANNAPNAKGAVDALSAQLPKLSPEARTQLLSSPGLDKLVKDKIGPEFTDPLKGEPWRDARMGPSAKPMESLQKLEKLIENADPALAQKLAEHGGDALVDFFSRAEKDGASIRLGIEGTRSLVHIAGQLGGPSQAGSTLNKLAELPIDATQLHMAVAEGARPDLLLAVAQAGGSSRVMDAATQGVQMYAGSVKGDVDALAKETDELTWLISNHGGSMTPAQLDQAIKDYTKAKGPDWEKKVADLENKVAGEGQKLLDQIESLRAAGPGQAGEAQKIIDGLMADTKSHYAISLALKKHPEYIDTGAGKRLMQSLAYDAKLGEQGIKLGKEVVNAYIRNDVLAAAHGYDPANAASIRQAEQAIEKLKNPALIKLLGMDVEGSKYQNYVKLVDQLKTTLPAAGDTTEQIVAKLKTHADAMNNIDDRLTAEGYKPTFEKNQPAGQLLRMVGIGFATVGFVNSVGKAQDGQINKNDLKAIVDAAGLGQKGTELAVGLGLVVEDSTLGRFGAGNKLNGVSIDPGRLGRADRVFGYLSAGFDYYNAGEQFLSKNGDPVKGGLYLASGVGGTMAALSGTSFAASLGAGSWAGPVGIALVAIATIGLGIKDRVDQSNVHMNDTSAAFLKHSDFNEAASKALVDQSGEGWSPVPLLTRYAESKGYKLDDPGQRQKFVDWVNGMPTDKLERLRDQLHYTLDDFDGDVSKLGADPTVYRPETYINSGGFPAKVYANASTVGHIDAIVRDFGIADLPHA
ncbi:LysM peptidoglycan-binding domain-containing protein [Lysobacter sp. K5869]|uniref:LysM peptidoglycan-binding domain-containing protein n=1 Tax=Lysobacter sp. K5869 TaxID=2820808 RepID=UPI001C0640C5|nr:LysM peptidoglycan-binding domain-containing protein [Lysobacter sp. K5869]QWP78377.1 LysM peptidoglycan-binding domain-containing protein [Lysobacter sp. K5869]